MTAILQKITEYLQKKSIKKQLRRAVSILACVVVFVTTYALLLPALSLEAKAKCGMEEHQHSEDCYERVLICGLEETEGHTHSEECYNEAGELICGLEEIPAHSHSESCYDLQLACGKEVHIHTEECYSQPDDNTAEEGEPEEGEAEEEQEASAQTEDEQGVLEDASAEDLAVLQEEDASEAEQAVDLEAVVNTADGETYRVNVSCGPESGIPADASLEVTEIEETSEEYAAYLAEVESALDSTRRVHTAKLFDISILDTEGTKLEPLAPVKVNIEFVPLEMPENSSVELFHFEEEQEAPVVMEDVELLTDENEAVSGLAFETDGFSVFGVVYTVDFLYEVNGESHSFTLQGGETLSLRFLIEDLHVVDAVKSDKGTVNEPSEASEVTGSEKAVDDFMENIETVTFSNTDYLVPVKVEEKMTAGQIKTLHHLFPTYPLGLTQDEVLALNETEVETGDWALISMKAFDTEESLTIALKSGETVVITVTDAQDAPMIGDQVQTITNPAGTTIDLFDYWIVSQDLVARDGWGDLNQGQGAEQAGDDKLLNGTGNNKGINASSDDSEHGHALKFSPAWEGTVYNGDKVGTTGNAWQSVNLNGRNGLNSYTGGINPFAGIVQDTLSGGYPVLTDDDEIGSTGESLAYLFDPSIGHSGKASYPDVNQLLYVDPDGYYTYDSRDYRADYNGDGTFTLTEQTSSDAEIRGFWPFGTQNFWVGMHVNTQFSMPAGGQVLNPSNELKDMQFEFSGDDDTWIYVDGVLIGDGGGIHNRTEIDINFRTGKVIINGEETGTIRSIIEAAKADEIQSFDEEQRAKWDAQWDGDTFAAGTYHTFDMFYLERGGGQSNLYIHYNLVSTADFTAHKSFHGTNEEDILKRDQFKFELVGLDGKYRSVWNEQTGSYDLVLEDDAARAIMPKTAAGTDGEGTVASPYYDANTTTPVNGQTVNSQTYRTGVTEDGNINFGTAEISQDDMNEADNGNPPVYKYIIREIVPDDAVNENGITWADASEEERAEGGFVKDDIIYDGTVYYMTGKVTSWEETNASGETIIRHGLSKTYYTDDTFTQVRENTPFVSFVNYYNASHGNISFHKKDEEGNSLAGATFALFRDPACLLPAKMIDVDNKPWVATSDENGEVSFENVRVGTYYMKETAAPEGYALSDTVYKVIIEDAEDPTKQSKIFINGDETETAISDIINTEAGKLSVVKKWLGASGNEIPGGDQQVSVNLYRRTDDSQVPAKAPNVTVVYHREGATWDLDVGNGTQVSVESVSSFDLKWHLGNDASHVLYDMKVNGVLYPNAADNVIDTGNGKIHWVPWDGSSSVMTVSDITGDMLIEFMSNCDWFSEKPAVSNKEDYAPPEIDTTPVMVGTIDLTPGTDWKAVKTIGGTLSSYEELGFDLPATDDRGYRYLYYVVERNASGEEIEVGEEPIVGYILDGYSSNNNVGVANQGVITVYNKLDQALVTDLLIKKADIDNILDDDPKLLKGAAFSLTKYTDISFKAIDKSWGTDASGSISLEDTKNEDGTYSLNGLFEFNDIPEGYYILTEYQFPEGYISVSDHPRFQVRSKADGSGLEIVQLVQDDSGSYVEGESELVHIIEGTATVHIGNKPGASLPDAGGPGTTLIYLAGSLLTVLALVGLHRKRQ